MIVTIELQAKQCCMGYECKHNSVSVSHTVLSFRGFHVIVYNYVHRSEPLKLPKYRLRSCGEYKYPIGVCSHIKL